MAANVPTAVSQVLQAIESFSTVVSKNEEHLMGIAAHSHSAGCNPQMIQIALNALQQKLGRLLQMEPEPQVFAPVTTKLIDSASRITAFPSLIMILSFFAGSLVERGSPVQENTALTYVDCLEKLISEAHQFADEFGIYEGLGNEDDDHGHSHGGGHGHSHGGHGHSHGDDEDECQDDDDGHGHSHGSHGHSHGGHDDHGHSHGGHDDHGHSHGGHDDHGHSHGGHDDHGHSHGGHDDHGHSHGGHGHSHGGHDDDDDHGHSHSHGGHDDHGHSHGGHGHSHGDDGGHGHSHDEPEPAGKEAFDILGRMCPPSSHFLSTFASARNKFTEKGELVEKMDKLRWLGGGVKMLHSLLRILNKEKLIVIHAGEKKGYVTTISGVADNHQLQTILMGVLCSLGEADSLKGTPLSEKIMDIMRNPAAPQMAEESIIGRWEMCHWTARLFPNRDLGDFDKTSVWGEGIPADIAYFRGERVLLLQEPHYQRTWNCVRVFGPMAAEVVVDRVLTLAEVEKYLSDFENATEEEKQEAFSEILHSVNKGE